MLTLAVTLPAGEPAVAVDSTPLSIASFRTHSRASELLASETSTNAIYECAQRKRPANPFDNGTPSLFIAVAPHGFDFHFTSTQRLSFAYLLLITLTSQGDTRRSDGRLLHFADVYNTAAEPQASVYVSEVCCAAHFFAMG